jgi:hypothetical protein
MSRTNQILHYLPRLGLGLIFLSNSLGAWYDTSSYMDLLRTSFFGRVFEDLRPWVGFIKYNDLLTGVLLLVGAWPKYVMAWAGLWMVAVAVVRVSATLFPWVY